MGMFEIPVGDDPQLVGAAQWRDELLAAIEQAENDGTTSPYAASVARETIENSWDVTDPRDCAWNVLETEIEEMKALQGVLNRLDE